MIPHSVAYLAAEHVSHVREVLADASGAVSIACWVTLLLPQLLEQWRLKSADGVAISFLMAWFVGDIANLAGAIIGGLRPSVILLALWFCFSDTLLIISYWYYKRLTSNMSRIDQNDLESAGNMARTGANPGSPKPSGSPSLMATTTTPLLQEPREYETFPDTMEGPAYRSNWLLSSGLPGVFVIVVATLSFFVSDAAESPTTIVKSPLASFLGYISAALYLLARIPQMLQNHRRRSVEGLSMGFFCLSVLGNVTYAGQVLIYRTDGEWVRTYLPWLLGSLGTIAEDLIILAQFHIYRRQ